MKKKAVALGFFDGVHLGHTALLRLCAAQAEKCGIEPCVLTYTNHPSEVLSKTPVKLLNTARERCEMIREYGEIENIITTDFTREYSNLSCREFADEILVSKLGAGFVVAGYDFRFGRGGAGGAKELSELCRERGIGFAMQNEIKLKNAPVSSTEIRRLITEGKIESANALLGHPHRITAEVTEGAKLGRVLGFPTINQLFGENIAEPKHGVYVSDVYADGKIYRGVTNIGTKPTVSNGGTVCAETHIIGFSGNLYGKRIKCELISFLREEKKFSSKEELCAFIKKDVETARLF